MALECSLQATGWRGPMSIPTAVIPIITGARGLAARYPVWLCDIWGVLHDGVVSFAPAVAALTSFRRAGGIAILITNAPRPHDDVARQIRGLGIGPEAYDAIITSGDVTRELIAGYRGKGLFHIGAEKDRSIFAGLDVHLVAAGEAAAIVCTGLVDDTHETPAAYADQLAALKARGLTMICANPDVVIMRGADLCYCAGALGEAYEKLGGAVAYAGKPYPPIYEAAMARAEAIREAPVAKREMLAIGDGMNTDILGAYRYGVDMLYVASGIHLEPGRDLDAGSLAKLFSGRDERPLAAVAELAW
jgi:HAD superfamily hydrolase (TIGR01459 family)